VDGFTLERCRRCRLVFVNPQYTGESLAELYTIRDTAALTDLYARIVSPLQIEQYRQSLRLLERGLPGRGRLLDFACAAGYFLEEASKAGWEAHGVDLGEWAKEAAEARGAQLNLHVGLLRDLRFPDHYFDVVYAAQVFEHLPQPREDLAEIRRILRPGGLLYVDVPNYRNLAGVLGKDDFLLNTPPQHINYFTAHTLSFLLKSAGFQDVRLSSSGGLKLENVFGRSTQSDIADAYRFSEKKGEDGPALGEAPLDRGGKHRLKQVVVSLFVKPVFYRWLKVGMTLAALARRP
jgi:2-polyprenyl-3-methyl-5-hydroxy-6-metoxy-1,4-benzoquinol methylase